MPEPMKFHGYFIAAAFAIAMAPTVAAAQDQPWLVDRQYTEGMGFRVGDFEFHPGAAAEFGYDTNFLHRADDQEPVGSLRLKITPSLSLSTLSPQRITPNTPPPSFNFRLGLSATYHEFFPVTGDEAGRNRLRNERNLTGLFDLRLDLLPGRPVSGALYGSLNRDIAPPSNLAQDEESFRRLGALAGGEIIFTPGSGLFDWRFGYEFDGTIFEVEQQLTSLQHTLRTRGRWRFLPRTAFLFDGKFGFITYPNNSRPSPHPMRALLGVNGLITSWLSLLAMVGWGASFYPEPSNPDFDSVIGQLEAKFYLTPNPAANPKGATYTVSSLSVGFLRDFYDSYISTFMERDRGYVKFSYFTAQRFLLTLDGGVGALVYPGTTINGDAGFHPAPWTDVQLDVTAFAEYRFKDWLGLNTTVRYSSNISKIPADEDDKLQWRQFEAYLGLRWLM
jgi:hypothetical protein